MKNLIINLGPAGDVLRTTVLLSELEGEIYWLSSIKCSDVLKSKRINKIYFIENQKDLSELQSINFDLIISLNEEIEALKALDNLKRKKLIGVFLNKGKIDYTPESNYWFDMSISSKLGKAKADELKQKNKKSLPQILIEMIGKSWDEQEYDLGIPSNETKGVIGIINIETGRWPNKLWAFYPELIKILEAKGYKVMILGMRPSIKDHITDINNCELIVTGDNLGMHIALALKKKVVTIFNCTSPSEIYDYYRMNKIISPKLSKFFYKKEFNKEATKAISLEEVLSVIEKLLKA